MPAPISVVIPTLNAQDALGQSLPALVEGLNAGLIRDLIISDAGSTDYTHKISDEVGAVWVVGAPSRGGQIARGIAMAKGDWILVLHADTVLPVGWAEACADHMQKYQAGYFDLRFDQRGVMPWLVSRWVWLRSRWLTLPYGDQALLISRATLDDIGGYPDLPLMEDVALARRLRALLRPIGMTVTTSAEKYRRRGWLRQGTRNLSMLVRFLAGADPKKLYNRYYPKA